MGSDLDRQALAIVEACLDLATQDRERLIGERCAGSQELIAKVRRMLALEEAGPGMLATEAMQRGRQPPERIPDRIGAYRVVGLIGSGGMGTVVRAERDDGLYSQTVAIKLARATLKDARAQELFAQERRILAKLNHPGIAHILDGGSVEGRPYLVMDYVEGGPVTAELTRRKASLSAILDRFEAVCDALGHAHRNLVVHGDIKPANVIVSADGAIKLIDFGVSRLIAELGGPEADGSYPFTPGYAAPERLDGAPPTVASDVYSLGALLHELLTGRRPRPEEELAEALTGSDGTVSARMLKGDLQAIIAKALAAAPADRYPDVAGLVEDLRRYRTDMPVLARAGDRRYRALKFIARHRRGLALTAAIFAGLVAATVITGSMYLAAERSRLESERRFSEVRSLARFMLFDLYDELRNAPGTVRARAAVAETGGRYLDRLLQVPAAPADLRLDSAQGYRRLATVQGLSGTASLGQTTAAQRSLSTAERLLRSVLAEQPRNAAAHEELGWVLASQWTVSSGRGAVSLMEAARRHFAQALALEPGRQGAELGRLATERARGYDLIYSLNHPKRAIPLLERAVADVRAVRWDAAHIADARLTEVNLLNRLGDAIYYAGDIPGALAPYREADAIVSRELAARETAQWLDKKGEAMWNLSGTLGDSGRLREALVHAATGVEALQRLLQYGPDANAEERLAILVAQEANLFTELKQHRAAAERSKRWYSMRRTRLQKAPDDGQNRRNFAVGLPPHADRLARIGDGQAACEAARSAVLLWEGLRRAGTLGDFDAKREVPAAKASKRRYCSG
jgi:hypothetical protein